MSGGDLPDQTEDSSEKTVVGMHSVETPRGFRGRVAGSSNEDGLNKDGQLWTPGNSGGHSFPNSKLPGLDKFNHSQLYHDRPLFTTTNRLSLFPFLLTLSPSVVVALNSPLYQSRLSVMSHDKAVRPTTLNFITGNANKLAEVRAILGDVVDLKSRRVDVDEIQGGIEDIARDKARRSAEIVSGTFLLATRSWTRPGDVADERHGESRRPMKCVRHGTRGRAMWNGLMTLILQLSRTRG